MGLLDSIKPPHKARILVAIGVKGKGVVLATDSDWVGMDIENLSDDVDEVGPGVDKDMEPGIYLWEGTMKMVLEGCPWDGQEWELHHKGDYRPVKPEELTELLAMTWEEPVLLKFEEPLIVEEDT